MKLLKKFAVKVKAPLPVFPLHRTVNKAFWLKNYLTELQKLVYNRA
jgi:hypothetical protein